MCTSNRVKYSRGKTFTWLLLECTCVFIALIANIRLGLKLLAGIKRQVALPSAPPPSCLLRMA